MELVGAMHLGLSKASAVHWGVFWVPSDAIQTRQFWVLGTANRSQEIPGIDYSVTSVDSVDIKSRYSDKHFLNSFSKLCRSRNPSATQIHSGFVAALLRGIVRFCHQKEPQIPRKSHSPTLPNETLRGKTLGAKHTWAAT